MILNGPKTITKTNVLNFFHNYHQCLLIISGRIALGILLDHFLLMTFPSGPWGNKPPFNWAVGFNRWDSGWYNSIAIHGYSSHQATAFFPGYPIMLKLINSLGIPIQYCGVILSLLSFIIGSILFYKLTRDYYGNYMAITALMLLVWSPTSVFLLSTYTESTFLLFTLLSFYFYDNYMKKNGNPGLVLLCAAIASSIRLTGTLIILSILMDMIWLMRNKISKHFIFKIICFSFIGELGFLSYSIYLFVKFKNPLLFISAEKHWDRVTTLPYFSVINSISDIFHNPHIFNGNTLIVFFINDLVALTALFLFYCIINAIKKNTLVVPLGWFTFTLLMLIISTSTSPGGQSPESIARYIMVIFPIYIALSRFIKKEIMWTFIMPITITLALLGQSLFNLGYWYT